MKISNHADHTEKLFGVRGEDIHRWIDTFFDTEGYENSKKTDGLGIDPYNHRQFRHCMESLEDAYIQFEGKYTKEQIKNVFETHLKDDYDGYLPRRTDFISGAFREKYHHGHEYEDDESILTHRELSEYFDHSSDDKKNDVNSSSTSFNIKLLIPTVIAVLLFISSIFILILPVVHDNIMDQKKATIKELTASAASVINHYINLENRGVLSHEVALIEAINTIRELRYGDENKDYFWITDMHPNMVMHPYRQDLVGKSLRDFKDVKNKSGKKLFVEFVELVKKNNEGYLKYQWQWKDNTKITAPKISYVRGIPQWGLIIGTGIYINDVEEEIYDLKIDLLITFSVISIVLLLILSNLLWQSHKIEIKRRRAASGLKEAKNRYRALVEGSGEGYILELNGEIIYSNRTLQKMLEYTEKEITTDVIHNSFFTEKDMNRVVLEHLKDLFEDKTKPGEYEAQILTKSRREIDVIVMTSKIFFSGNNGHMISFRPLFRDKSLAASTVSAVPTDHFTLLSSITHEIENSDNIGHVVEALNKMPLMVRDMLEQGSRPDSLRRVIGTAYNAAIARFINFAIVELGEPPVKFSFLSLGSNARHEMTMFSDQDNALVFEDVPESELNEIRRYFLNLAERVCKKLDQAGYQYCPGDIMAVNPKWCLSVSEWKQNYKGWISNATAASIFEVNVFFDIHSSYGEKKLLNELTQCVQEETRKNPQFFLLYAKNCLLYRPPLNIFGQIKTKEDVINLKQCLRPLELFGRIYALKHDIHVTNTLGRLSLLRDKNVIEEQTYKAMVFIFNHLWHLRFKNQVIQHAELRKVNDNLNLSYLTDVEQQNLKNVLSQISSFQTMLSYDFLGVPLG